MSTPLHFPPLTSFLSLPSTFTLPLLLFALDVGPFNPAKEV